MPWVVAMDWIDALFLHWPLDAAQLRDKVPLDLAIDTYEGSAWISIVAFKIAGARPRGVPRALAWRTFPEINVRTYVTGAGHAGVWFFSLDADSRLAVAVARLGVNLAYHRASIRTEFAADSARFGLVRTQADAPAARFAAQAAFGGDARVSAPGSLDQFLAERYCFFTRDRSGRTRRGDVTHQPWALRDAIVQTEENTLISSLGIDVAPRHALAHASPGVATRGWPLR
ncbi:MAG TPA: DUF2071 domain-containing protein [Candidatus Elarobacter sp.]|jgi:hypothetical protein|nr:DUF2071 domain-containing protein [Candidatus Elarobacter sp.]